MDRRQLIFTGLLLMTLGSVPAADGVPGQAMMYYEVAEGFALMGDLQSAYELLDQAHEAGLPDHLYGPRIYDYAQALMRNNEQQTAYELLLKSDRARTPEASMAIGVLYLTGKVKLGSEDFEHAQGIAYLEKSYSRGCVVAALALGKVYMDLARQHEQRAVNLARAEKWYALASRDGNAEAMLEYGIYLSQGHFGANRGDDGAIWIQKAKDVRSSVAAQASEYMTSNPVKESH